MPFVSKLFPKWHCKRLLRTDPLKALVIGGFVRGLSMRDVESLCEEAGLGKTSRSTVARICAELHERFEAFCRRSLYDVQAGRAVPRRDLPPGEAERTEGGRDLRLGNRRERPQGAGFRASGRPRVQGGLDRARPRSHRPRTRCSAPRRRRRRARTDQRRRGDVATRGPSALRRSPLAQSPREGPQGRARPDPVQLLVSAHRRDLGEGRQAPPADPDLRTRAPRLRVRRPLPRRRPRRARRASALPAQAPRTVAVKRTSSNDRSARSAGAPR